MKRSLPLVLLFAALLAGCRSHQHALGRSDRVIEKTLPERRSAEVPFVRPSFPSPPAPEPVASGSAYLAGREANKRPSLADDTLHQLDLRGAPLSEALHLLAASAGINIYLDAGLDRSIDASFPAVRLDDALGVLLERNGLALVEEPAGVYWVTRQDGSEIETVRFELECVKAVDILANLQTLVGEDAELVADSAQNFIFVRGPQSEVEEVAAYLEYADRLKQQVLIEVEILEVILDDRFELGVSALLQDPNFLGEAAVDVVQNLATSDLSFTGVLSLNDSPIDVTVNALESYGVVNVLSSPRVMAVDNTESSIEVVTEIPYIEATTEITSGTGNNGSTATEEVAFKEAGIKLTVTPGIQARGIVGLVIEQEFSEVIDEFRGIPVLDNRKVASTFLVEGEDTVVIGGLIQSRVVETERGVPILMHVPLLGRLFRSDEDTLSRRELVVLITPRILEPSQAAAYARKYRADYHERLDTLGVRDNLGE